MKTNKETAIDWENEFKRKCSKEITDLKAGKRKSATTKILYLLPSAHGEWAEEYNKRNDNDKPWFEVKYE